MDEIIVKRIRELREDHDLSQAKVAKVLHIAPRTYSGYETGSRAIPVPILVQLAKFYDVSLHWVCGLSEEKES